MNILEKKAKKQLGIVKGFMTQIKNAKKSAEQLNNDAQIEITKAKCIQKDCNSVISFAEKVTKL